MGDLYLSDLQAIKDIIIKGPAEAYNHNENARIALASATRVSYNGEDHRTVLRRADLFLSWLEMQEAK